jgi:hypothetical protein
MAEVVGETWLPVSKGLNQINRSMGKPDLYPFVLPQPVIAKLAFVADLVADAEPFPGISDADDAKLLRHAAASLLEL